jgi:hypothetical protein
MLYAGLVKLYPAVLELLMCAVFRLVIIQKMVSLECILEGAKNTEVGGWYMGTIGRMRGTVYTLLL